MIDRRTLEDYLNCRQKGCLRLAGEAGVPTDYEVMTAAAVRASREATLSDLATRLGGVAVRGTAATAATLGRGESLLVDVDLRHEGLSVRLDGLRRQDGPSGLGVHHYLPVLYHPGDRVGRHQRQLLALLGLILGRVQGRRPAVGLTVAGPGARFRRVRLDAAAYRRAEQVLAEVERLRDGGDPPRLALNGHCPACEFRQRCRTKAVADDDISLLDGVGEKELRRYHRKGLFTLTQLSCTFRPRKKGKRAKRPAAVRYSALQALAIREKKVHVYGTPDLPRGPVQLYLDAEGDESGGFVYLLGVLVAEGGTRTRYSFWADSRADEGAAFDAFLDLLARYDGCPVFHYGSYERAVLRRMRGVVRRKRLVDRVLAVAVNLVSVTHPAVYFPTFSNGLKAVGGYLGCTWTEPNASGLQSLVWRARWEQTGDRDWRDKLVTYNAEDCAALGRVVEYVQAVAEAARRRAAGSGTGPSDPAVAWADEAVVPSTRREWGGPHFVLADFEHVNRCAYFDYQREKVFLRTSGAVRAACVRRRRKARKPRPNRVVEFRSNRCPFCKGTRITRLAGERHSKVAYDLRLTPGGIRRQVIRCTAARHRCDGCGRTYLPKRYKRRDKHLHALQCWAMYQHVVHRISLQSVEAMFEECFGLRVGLQELQTMKALMARRYRVTWKGILGRVVAGRLAHVDETQVNLQKGKGYVWVLTNLQDVAYMYRPSREAEFLHGLLAGFGGVLVSDFYGGYDSLPCEQQKCLVHLIRDLNQDLAGHPYDEEFKALAGEFGTLLRSIAVTIDRYGLKECHLRTHKVEVARFFASLAGRTYRSELAEGYQRRLAKNRGKLFVFLDHDGVPWNNNNAEHAIKYFAYYRRIADGKMREGGLSDYLVLLSIYQTCKYRGVSFLRFLLSRQRDVEAFCRRPGERLPPPRVDVYPPGFPRKHCARKGKPDAGGV